MLEYNERITNNSDEIIVNLFQTPLVVPIIIL